MSKKVSRPARLVLRPEEKARLRLRARTSRVNNQLHKQERDLDSSQLYNFLQQNASVFELHNETGAPLNDLMKIINRTKLDALADEKLFELLVKRINGCFFNEDCRVRALSFRIVRSLTTNERRLIFLLQRHIDICLIRALDIDENCEAERLEAIKFIGRLLHLYENSRFKKFFEATELEMSKKVELELNDPLFLFPKSVLKSITAVALRQLPKIIEKRVAKTTDNLSFPALGILLEISASNPELVLECAGTDWIVRALIGVGASNAKLSNLVCRVLTKWLDSPVLREKAELHLVIEQIFAPLIDLGFFAQTGKDSLTSIPSKNMETLDACANVFLAILRSWAGVFACASTSENGGIATSSPLKLLEYLGLGTVINSNLSKIRDLVINICCEFVDLPYASKKFTSWDDAVLVYSQMHLPDPYRCSLRDDFVVAEASSLVSSGLLFCDYVDLLASFRAAATYILINVGLPQSLVRLILARPDDPMSIKATLLLADVLRTSASFLPRDWRLRIISVPTLIQSAAETFVTSSNIVRMVREGKKLTNLYHTFSNSENALLLISRLDQLNNICLSRQNTLENLQNINYFVLAGKQSKRSLRHRADSLQEEPQDLSEMMSNAFYNDNLPNWLQVDRVLQLLERDNCELLKRNKHSEKCHTFFANLLFYFKPSAQKLVTEPFDRLKIRCGCCAFSLVSTLLIEPYYSQMMGDFMTNFRDQLEPNTLHSGVFASKYLNNSGAMYYFSLISAICSTEDGYEFLERMRIFQL
uniref:Rapamycin-insensitive companion of mTOR N-terminal domain-containing protein n=1 Tax=Acrobeloides nanus TaxID=290746 RepID=A0A914DG49_9BILA